MGDTTGSRSSPSFWTDPNRTLLGLGYMGGSLMAFVAGMFEGTVGQVAFVGWIVLTILFYLTVRAVLRGGRSSN